MSNIKPFQRNQNFTMVPNVIVDHIMPIVSTAALRVLLVIVRNTMGWQREETEISYARLMKSTGIKSRTTISKALKELEENNIIFKTVIDHQQSSNRYSINTDFEIENDGTSPINEPVQKLDYPSPENEPPQSNKWTTDSPKNGLPLVQKMDSYKESTTKENIKESIKENTSKKTRAKNAQSDFSSETMASENSESSSVIPSDSVSESDYQPPQALEPPKQSWRDIHEDTRAQKLADICGVDTNWGTPKQLWDVAHEFKALVEMGMTVERLDAFVDWWRNHDWRGKKGDLPRPVQVRELWRQFERFTQGMTRQSKEDFNHEVGSGINPQGIEYDKLNSPDRNIRNEARIENAMRKFFA